MPKNSRTSRVISKEYADEQEFELAALQREIATLKGALAETRVAVHNRRGVKRTCCLFGVALGIAAALLAPPALLRGAVRKELGDTVQPYADWVLQHPLVPKGAVDLAASVLGDHSASGPKGFKQGPGARLKELGFAKKHPVVFVPGFTSSALEVWRSDLPCGAGRLAPRARLYGGPAMSLMTTDLGCWLAHMALNATTWRDPDAVKMRAASGLSAADYFGFSMESLFLWGKIIKELAVLGYDESSMHMAAYDWRISMADLEQRDRYFTKLKAAIEELVAANNGEKVCLMAHSMGSNVWQHFMQWVSSPAQGPGHHLKWVDAHVSQVVLIGNSLLGSPKILNSLLTGNLRDVMELWSPVRSLLGSLVSRHDFAGIFRSWGSMAMLMPVGGEGMWGNGSHAPDGNHLGHMLTFTPPPPPLSKEEDSLKPQPTKAAIIPGTSATPKAAQAAAKAAAHASELATAAITAASLAVKSGTNPADDPNVQRATEASEALAVSKAKHEAIAAEESLRASATGAATAATSPSMSSSSTRSTARAPSAKKPGAPPVEPNGLSEARRRFLLGVDEDVYSDDAGITSDSLSDENVDNDNNNNDSGTSGSNGSCISSNSNGTCSNVHDYNTSVVTDNWTTRQQQQRHLNRTGLTATGALSLLREVAPRYGALFDANYDFRGRLEMQGRGGNKFWKPRASEKEAQAKTAAAGSATATTATTTATAGGKDGRKAPWRAGAGSPSSWHNPLARPLPPAPGMTMYCFHGTGLPTDRAYVLSGARDYHHEEVEGFSQSPSSKPPSSPTAREDGEGKNTEGSSSTSGSNVSANSSSDRSTSTAVNTTSEVASSSSSSADHYQSTLPFEVDVDAHDPSNGLHHGVRLVEGDGTITNLALALPCAKIWKDPVYNPGGAKVVLREYRHRNLETLGTLTSLWSTYNQAPMSDVVDAHQSAESAAAAAAAGDAAGAAGAAMEVNAVSLCGAFPEKEAAVSSSGVNKDADTKSRNSSPTCLAVDLDGDGSPDVHLWDTTGDGVPDTYDSNGDGSPDALPPTALFQPTHAAASNNNASSSSGSSSRNSSSGNNSSGSTNGRGYWSELAEQLREADYGAFGRGLGLAADHVNILGNNALVLDVLLIAVGAAHQADCSHLDAQASAARRVSAEKAAEVAAAKTNGSNSGSGSGTAQSNSSPPEARVVAAAEAAAKAAANAAAAAAECHTNRVGDRVESDVLSQAARVVV